MKAEKNKVVSFHYSVADAAGEMVESSRDKGKPVVTLLGHSGMIAGLESALEGREAGETFDVSVEPELAYGPRREDMQQRVPKKYFQQAGRLKVGDITVLALKEGGQRMVSVVKVGMTTVDVDLNHPLSGQTLRFNVEVTDVRDATAEEIEHGHAHGEGGHQH